MDATARAEPDSNFRRSALSEGVHTQPNLLVAMWNVLKWRKGELLNAVLVALMLAILAMLTMTPKYTAVASLQVETSQRSRSGSSGDKASTDSPIDNAILESQIEIARSDRVARTVIDKLKLWNDAEFNRADQLISLSNAAPAPADPDNEIAKGAVVNTFKKNLNVFRYGRSYIAEVAFTGTDPVKAAKIANAVADEYIDDVFNAKATAAHRTGEWLISRVAAIREKTAQATESIEELKARNNITGEGATRVASNRENELLTAELKVTVDNVARLQSLLGKAQAALDSDVIPAELPPELATAELGKLHAEYRAVLERQGTPNGQSRDASDASRLSDVIAKQIRDRMATDKAELAAAELRQKDMQLRITDSDQRKTTNRQNFIKLRELEAEEQSYKALYESALSRQIQATDEQTYPVTDARIISRAAPPAAKASPRPLPMLLLGGFAGALAGFGLMTMKEVRRRPIREPEELEAAGLPGLGTLPLVAGRKIFPKGRRSMPLLMRDRTDALRRTKLAVANMCGANTGCVVGITSANDGVGRSTVAYNFASVLAEDQHKVLLIDGDFRDPTLTRGLEVKDMTRPGYVHGDDASKVTKVVTDSGFEFIGKIPAAASAHPSVVLSGRAFRDLVHSGSQSYDYVIVDLPSASQHVDVVAAAHLFDAFVIVGEWGSTAQSALLRTLASSDDFARRVAGLIINKTPRRFRRSLDT